MKLEFGRIEIHNFLSYKDEVFDFSSNDGMNLICGYNRDIVSSSNGSGKSALVGSLIFALFGQTLNKIKTENIPNRYMPVTEPCNVILWFKVDDIQYRIESGLAPKHRGGICNIFRINEDGSETDLSKSSIRETRKFVENEILCCDLSIFLRTIVLTSDQTYNFFKLTTYQKKEFIEQIFDLSIFGDMYRLIHKDNLALDKEIYAMQRELLSMNNTYRDYETQYEEHTIKKKAQCKDIVIEIKELAEKIKSLNVPETSEKSEKLKECNDKCVKVLGIYNKQLNEIGHKLQVLDKEQHKLRSVMSEKTSIIKKHAEMFEKLCEKCAPIFDDHYTISDTKKQINLINDKIRQIEDAIIKLNSKKNDINKQHTSYNNAMKKIKEKDADLNEKMSGYENEKSRALYKIKMLKEKLNTLKDESNPYDKLLVSAKESLSKAQDDLDKRVRRMKYLKYAEAIVSQDTLRKFIIKDLITLLNSQIKIYLNKIGSKFTCEFDDMMNYTFITENGYAEYDNFSSGEKMRLSIATSFAFRDFMATRSNIVSNVLILDEYIDSNLDSASINALIKILREFIVRYKQSIYIVSHRKEINNDIFNNIIIVEKKNGISQIVYDEKNNSKTEKETDIREEKETENA